MSSSIYWIETRSGLRLAIMARPRAGDWLADEVDNWRREQIDCVVSLLEPEEVADLGLQGVAALCAERGIELLSFPIPDRATPADAQAAVDLAQRIKDQGQATAIHCRAGIGRSSIMAALVLILDGATADEAFARISAARGVLTPDTDEQRAWASAMEGSIRAMRSR